MEATAITKKTPGRSEIILIGSNAIAIILAIVFHYDFAIVIWSYWLESIIIGGYAVLSMMLAGFRLNEKDNVSVLTGSKWAGFVVLLAGAGFFTVHYGLFHLVYMIFLMAMPITSLEWAQIPFVLLTGGIFLLSHGASFLEHTVKHKKTSGSWEHEVGASFRKPYDRIVPMHITIIASGFVMAIVSGELASQILLIVLMILKTGVDLASHRAKHNLGS